MEEYGTLHAPPLQRPGHLSSTNYGVQSCGAFCPRTLVTVLPFVLCSQAWPTKLNLRLTVVAIRLAARWLSCKPLCGAPRAGDSWKNSFVSAIPAYPSIDAVAHVQHKSYAMPCSARGILTLAQSRSWEDERQRMSSFLSGCPLLRSPGCFEWDEQHN